MTIQFNKFFIWSFTLAYIFFTHINLRAETIEERPKKVALMFLTTNDLNHSKFWKKYLKPHTDKFTIYIHSKNPIKDKFFKQFSILKRVETTWANTIKAEKALITEAFLNLENYKFVLLSESCVPLVSAEVLYETLVRDDKSYFYWTGGGWWEPTNPREVTELPVKHRKGNHMWIVLNRKHAKICIEDKKIINIISKHPNDQESYPSSLFSIYGCLEEVVNFGFTFVDWSRPGGGGAHPYTFTNANPNDLEMLNAARERGHLIGRKFAPEFPVEVLFSEPS